MRRSRNFIVKPKPVATADPSLLFSPLLGIAFQPGPAGSGGRATPEESAGGHASPPGSRPQDGGRFPKRNSPTAGPRAPDGGGIRRSGPPPCPTPGADCPPDG